MRHLAKFESYEDYKDVFKARREERENQQINRMLGDAVMFQKMKLTKEVTKLEDSKRQIENQMDNDPFVASDPSPETNPIVVEYQGKISEIDAEIAILREKIANLE